MFLSEMYESAEENGFNKGKDVTTNTMIDNMLKTGLSIEQIETISGKSKDYIEMRRKALKDGTLVGA